MALALPILFLGQLHAQDCYFSDFNNLSCIMTTAPGIACPSWNGSCGGWVKSHGTPILGTVTLTDPTTGITAPFGEIFMFGGATEGEGMFRAYPFQSGQSYDVRLVFISTSTNPGEVNIFAANGLTEHTLGSCSNGVPVVPKQQIGPYSGNTNGVKTDVTFSFTANNNYSQLWIYPDGTGDQGDHQYNLILLSVFVCRSCIIPKRIFNTGVLPAGTTSAGTIQAGSTAGSGGSGTVVVAAGQTTTLVATQEVDVLQNFSASASGGGVFNIQLAPCSGVNTLALSVPDSAVIANPRQFESDLIAEQMGQSDQLAVSKLQVAPSISTGAFTITGSAADLGNANIVVTDASGRLVYRLHNNDDTRIDLNLGKWGTGIYFLQIRNGTNVTTKKLIVSK